MLICGRETASGKPDKKGDAGGEEAFDGVGLMFGMNCGVAVGEGVLSQKE